MTMKVTPLAIPEVLLVEPKVFGDARGFFVETFNAKRYAEHGIDLPFVQDNASLSRRGVLRGLHLQNPSPQGKLVSVLRGQVVDVAVDVRVGSPTFGRWVSAVLSEEDKRQLWVPPGFAHGFAVTSDEALFVYKCTDLYNPPAELCLLWNDPDIGIDWQIDAPTLSPRDAQGLRLRDVPRDRLPQYRP
jgi:dTDP-4-dehydrorhamnose 3,5-epimerase